MSKSQFIELVKTLANEMELMLKDREAANKARCTYEQIIAHINKQRSLNEIDKFLPLSYCSEPRFVNKSKMDKKVLALADQLRKGGIEALLDIEKMYHIFSVYYSLMFLTDNSKSKKRGGEPITAEALIEMG